MEKSIDQKETGPQVIAKQIKNWFDQRKFETKAIDQDGNYQIKARKNRGLHSFTRADRVIEVSICTIDQEMRVEVRQGSWKTNAISTPSRIAVAGGKNFAISGWSILIQKELENYIRKLLDDLSGKGN